jgi:hypothetical protein
MTDILTYYTALGLFSVAWLLVRMFATVALWPVPVAMYVQEKWQKGTDW